MFFPLNTMEQLTPNVQQRIMTENIGVLRRSTVTEVTMVIGVTVGQPAT